MSYSLDIRNPLRIPWLQSPPVSDEAGDEHSSDEVRSDSRELVTAVNPIDGLEYSRISDCEVWIGAEPDDDEARAQEQPRRLVRLSSAYWIGRTPVTVAAYQRYCQAMGQPMPDAPAFNRDWENVDHPIVNVSHLDALGYCKWAEARLPTEAEWEHAAAGPVASTFPWGPEVSTAKANFGKSTWGTTPVGRYAANDFGLYDLAGNVWEWCADWFGPYPDRAETDPQGPKRSKTRVLRGGSWLGEWWSVRCTHRGRFPPDAILGTVGFRCVWVGHPGETGQRVA